MTEAADLVQVFYAPDPATDDFVEITNYVLFAESRFTSLMAAVPGNWTLACRDPERVLDFTTGHEIRVDLNGTPAYGGYVWEVRKTYMFPADDTAGDVMSRKWVLSGTDYNVIFDKRVLRNPAHYNKQIFSPGTSSGSIAVITPITDGEVIRDHLRFYFDLSGFDTENTDRITDNWTFEKGYPWPTQGTKFRGIMEDLAKAGATTAEASYQSIFWVDASRHLHFIQEQELALDWGFSDRPNNTTMYPFREGSASTNAMSIVNDGLVWGGSEWAKHGDIVFAREQDAASQALHDRWQASDVGVGNFEYNSQAQVDAKANAMIFGPPGTFAGKNMGLTLPEQTFTATWFNARVPEIPVPGFVLPVQLEVFGGDPVELPLRSLTISWPTIDSDTDGRGWTRLTGEFGLLMSDPSWLWRYLQKLRPGKIIKQVTATAKNDTSKPPYGAQYQDQPATQSIVGEDLVVTLDAPNGSKTLFHIPFMYVGNTMKVFIDGIAQYRGIDYVETSPALGTFTIYVAPASDAKLWVWAVVAGALVG